MFRHGHLVPSTLLQERGRVLCLAVLRTGQCLAGSVLTDDRLSGSVEAICGFYLSRPQLERFFFPCSLPFHISSCPDLFLASLAPWPLRDLSDRPIMAPSLSWAVVLSALASQAALASPTNASAQSFVHFSTVPGYFMQDDSSTSAEGFLYVIFGSLYFLLHGGSLTRST